MKGKKELDKLKERVKNAGFGNLISIIENMDPEDRNDQELMSELVKLNPDVKNVLEILELDEKSQTIQEYVDEFDLKELASDPEILSGLSAKYREPLYEVAKEYEEEEDYETAKSIYLKIQEFGIGQVEKFAKRTKNEKQLTKMSQNTIYYKAKFSYYICKIKNGEPLTSEDLKELNKLAREDKNNILKLRNPGIISDFDKFVACFDDIDTGVLENEILPAISTGKNKGNKREPNPNPPKNSTVYSDELSPENRYKFIKDNFEIERVKIGKGKFAGYCIFEIKNSDVVIVEKFFDTKGRGKTKEIVPSEGTAATYLVHKDADIDIEKSDIHTLVAKGKSERIKNEFPLVRATRHTENYYRNLKKNYNTIVLNGERIKGITPTIIEETENSNTKKAEEIEVIESDEHIDKQSKEEKKKSKDKVTNTTTANALLQKIKELDLEYNKLKSELNNNAKLAEQLGNRVNDIRNKISGGISDSLTDEIISTIQKELELLKNLQEQLNEINECQKRAEKQIIENRNKRKKAEKEFNEIVFGDE